MNVNILQVAVLMLPMSSRGDNLSAGTGTGSGPGWLPFRRIVDIPSETYAAALKGWRREGHNGELQLGQSRLRGPVEHDRGPGTCRVEVRLTAAPAVAHEAEPRSLVPALGGVGLPTRAGGGGAAGRAR